MNEMAALHWWLLIIGSLFFDPFPAP